jgi:hypothetical protein
MFLIFLAETVPSFKGRQSRFYLNAKKLRFSVILGTLVLSFGGSEATFGFPGLMMEKRVTINNKRPLNFWTLFRRVLQ